jgi:hypothetical protein
MIPKWYLVKTRPLYESRVHTRLTEAGFETIYPKILKKIKGRDRFAGLDAIFVEALPDRERVVLLLEAASGFRVILKKEVLDT